MFLVVFANVHVFVYICFLQWFFDVCLLVAWRRQDFGRQKAWAEAGNNTPIVVIVVIIVIVVVIVVVVVVVVVMVTTTTNHWFV